MIKANFSHPKRVNSQKAWKLYRTNLEKRPQTLDIKTRLKEQDLPFYHFSAKSYAIDKFSCREGISHQNPNKNRGTLKDYAPLQRAFHKESNKTLFDIFIAVYK